MKKNNDIPVDLSIDQLKQIYELEKLLSNKLRSADKQTRRYLYSQVYEEYFSALSHHPQILMKTHPDRLKKKIDFQMKIIRKFTSNSDVFLEVGAGDGNLCLEVSKIAKFVYACEVSNTISKGLEFPNNFQLILFDGFTFSMPPESVNIVYSNSLIEHLHIEDAYDQLKSIYSIIIKGGIYICVTPNRHSGPHDISRYFDDPYSCFHLMEYSGIELRRLFLNVGFRKGNFYIFIKGNYYQVPYIMIYCFELFLTLVNQKSKQFLISSKIGRILLDYIFVGKK